MRGGSPGSTEMSPQVAVCFLPSNGFATAASLYHGDHVRDFRWLNSECGAGGLSAEV